MPKLDALNQAERLLGSVAASLETANSDATGVESLLLVPLIADARALRDKVNSLRSAMRENAQGARA